MLSSIPDPSLPYVLVGALSRVESDCACPAAPSPMFSPARTESLYERASELYIAPLREDWTLVCNALAGGAPAVLNTSAMCALDMFATPRLPVSAIDRQLAEAQLITPIDTRSAVPIDRSSTLTAWLHVTNACNLDCPYCYVRKSGAKTSLETGIKAVDALFTTAKQQGFTTIKLKYAGGEAALQYRLVQQIHAYAVRQAEQCGLALQAVVLSNGTVMPVAFADWLALSGVRLMVSVDGVDADHDLQRPWKNGGGGVFHALERNLHERLLPRGIRPDICITITGRTAHNAWKVVAWTIAHGLPFSLNFYRENDQSAKYHELRYEEQGIIAGLLSAYAAVERELPSEPFLDGLLDRVQAQAHSHTCGVGQNYVVITHEGQIAQCQMDLQAAKPFRSDMNLIHIVADGPIHNVSVDEKIGCRDCKWRYRCAGGCPIVTLRATGRTDIKSPNCRIYQALMPAALRLEGLRVLKVHGQL
jgi:uncharacterized protein